MAALETTSQKRYTLLMFTRNDLDAASVLASRYGHLFSRTLIVDSSDPQHHLHYTQPLRDRGADVHRALPLGDPDLLRPYAVSLVSTDRVFELDTDESISNHLMDNLHHLDRYDACILPRFERRLGAYTRLLRIYDPRKIRFINPSYSFPAVDGQVGVPDRRYCVIHEADYSVYLSSRSRRSRHFMIESLERPFTRQYVINSLSLKVGSKRLKPPGLRVIIGTPGRPVCDAAVVFSLLIEFCTLILTSGSYAWAKFMLSYGLEKLEYMNSLSPEEKALRYAIARDIRTCGSLISYLGLGDPGIVSSLTGSFDWSLDPPSLVMMLARYRYERGYPMDAMTQS